MAAEYRTLPSQSGPAGELIPTDAPLSASSAEFDRGYAGGGSALTSPGMEGFEEQGTPKGLPGTLPLEEMEQQDLLLKKRLRTIKFVLRAATLILAIYMTITMAITIHKYLSTRHHLVRVQPGAAPRGPWNKETTTWPTVLLLCTSSVTVIFNLIVVVAYIRSVRAANAVHDWAGYAQYTIFATHMGMWIATAVLYRTGKTGRDLWGWSCSDKAKVIQPDFEGVVDFAKYCRVQTGSWGTGLAEAGVSILSVFVYYLGYRRLQHKRTMAAMHSVELKESRFAKYIPTRINTGNLDNQRAGSSKFMRLLRVQR